MHTTNLIGEFFGVYLLSFIYFATGSPLAFGLAVAIFAQFVCPISNSSLNPFFYVGDYIGGKQGGTEVITRIVIGAIAAGLAWYTMDYLKRSSHIKFPSHFA